MKKILISALVLILTISWQTIAFAQQPGDIICAIQGVSPTSDPAKLYTNGSPYSGGTLIVNGNCSWQQGVGCGKFKINNQGASLNASQYQYMCPIDDYVPLLIIALGLVGYVAIKKVLLVT